MERNASAKGAAMTNGPLSGLRVIDMTAVVMGPWATHILADFGADVVKVEVPGGDIMRAAGIGRHADMGPLFLHGNRSKRSIVLDVKRPEGREALLRLVATADVFVHNVRRAAMQKLRLRFDDIARVNERAIYVSLVGYGQTGPYADRPAYDDLIQGASGLASLFATVDGETGEPRLVPALLADRIGGISAVNAILAAVVDRARTQRGCAVEVPMFETMVELVLADHLGGDSFVPPTGPPGYARALTRERRPYRTADGYVCVLLYNELHWERFFALAGEIDAYRRDPRLSDRATRARNYDAAYGIVAELIARQTTAYWLRELEAADVPAMPYHDLATLRTDPHLAATQFVRDIDHPSEGRTRSLGVPVRNSAHAPADPRPAPRLGEHSRDILAEAGYTPAEIARLAAGGITVIAPADA
ncbi:MAG: CoA transferase [Vulcanimicrobiaceae bacterium]